MIRPPIAEIPGADAPPKRRTPPADAVVIGVASEQQPGPGLANSARFPVGKSDCTIPTVAITSKLFVFSCPGKGDAFLTYQMEGRG